MITHDKSAGAVPCSYMICTWLRERVGCMGRGCRLRVSIGIQKVWQTFFPSILLAIVHLKKSGQIHGSSFEIHCVLHGAPRPNLTKWTILMASEVRVTTDLVTGLTRGLQCLPLLTRLYSPSSAPLGYKKLDVQRSGIWRIFWDRLCWDWLISNPQKGDLLSMWASFDSLGLRVDFCSFQTMACPNTGCGYWRASAEWMLDKNLWCLPKAFDGANTEDTMMAPKLGNFRSSWTTVLLFNKTSFAMASDVTWLDLSGRTWPTLSGARKRLTLLRSSTGPYRHWHYHCKYRF